MSNDPLDLASQALQEAETVLSREVSPKMPCPVCGYTVSRVAPKFHGQARQAGYARWRRCEGCQRVFETIETPTGLVA